MQLSSSSAFSRRWITASRLLKSGKLKEIFIRTYRIIKRRKSKFRLIDYADWHEEWVEVDQKDTKRITELIDSLPHQPFFSIVLHLDVTDHAAATSTIESIKEQIYPNWKLHIITSRNINSESLQKNISTDDDRIKITNVEDYDLNDGWIS